MIIIKKFIKILILLLVFLLIPLTCFVGMDNYFGKRSTDYLEHAVVFAASDIFTEASFVCSEYSDKIGYIHYIYDDNNQITSCYVDTDSANLILAKVSEVISDAIDKDILNHRLSEVKIPLGQMLSTSIFANLGPRLTIHVDPIYSFVTDIYTTCKSIGINNTQIEVYILITLNVEAFIPLKHDTFTVNTKIYLTSVVLQGDIPLFYKD